MPRRVFFDKAVIDVPPGFSVTANDWVGSMWRKKPPGSIGIADCAAAPGGWDYAAIRMGRGGSAAIVTEAGYARELFPDIDARENLVRSPPNPVYPEMREVYTWHAHLRDFRGMNLLFEFSGRYERFDDDMPLWRAVLASLSPATDDDRRRAAAIDDYEIPPGKFAAWGKKIPGWTPGMKKRPLPVDYPGDEPDARDRRVVAVFRERGAAVADAVCEKMFAAFAAKQYPFMEGLDDDYAALGLRPRKAGGMAGHMMLAGVSVLPTDAGWAWRVRLSLEVVWTAHGQQVLVGGLSSGNGSEEIVVELGDGE